MAIVRSPSGIKAETTKAVHQVTIGLVADSIGVENTIKTWLVYDGYMMANHAYMMANNWFMMAR